MSRTGSLAREQAPVIEHLEGLLSPLTRQILTNRPDLNTNVNRQTLSYALYYDCSAGKRKLKVTKSCVRKRMTSELKSRATCRCPVSPVI